MHSYKTVEELHEALRAGALLIAEAEKLIIRANNRSEQLAKENEKLKKQIEVLKRA